MYSSIFDIFDIFLKNKLLVKYFAGIEQIRYDFDSLCCNSL
jgi:hypothetical protein